MDRKTLRTTTVIEEVTQDQLPPDTDPDVYTDVMMDMTCQFSEAVEQIGSINDINVQPEDVGVRSEASIELVPDIVACFVLDAHETKFFGPVAQAIREKRTYLVIIFSMARLTERSAKDPTGEHSTVLCAGIENISVGLNESIDPDSQLSSTILIPGKPFSPVRPVETYSARDFWGDKDALESIEQILKRGLQRRTDIHSLL